MSHSVTCFLVVHQIIMKCVCLGHKVDKDDVIVTLLGQISSMTLVFLIAVFHTCRLSSVRLEATVRKNPDTTQFLCYCCGENKKHAVWKFIWNFQNQMISCIRGHRIIHACLRRRNCDKVQYSLDASCKTIQNKGMRQGEECGDIACMHRGVSIMISSWNMHVSSLTCSCSILPSGNSTDQMVLQKIHLVANYARPSDSYSLFLQVWRTPWSISLLTGISDGPLQDNSTRDQTI